MTTPIDAELLEAHIQINCILLVRTMSMLGALQLYVSCRCMQQLMMFSCMIISLTMRNHFNTTTCLIFYQNATINNLTMIYLYSCDDVYCFASPYHKWHVQRYKILPIGSTHDITMGVLFPKVTKHCVESTE